MICDAYLAVVLIVDTNLLNCAVRTDVYVRRPMYVRACACVGMRQSSIGHLRHLSCVSMSETIAMVFLENLGGATMKMRLSFSVVSQ